jgi:O-acetylserine/cysteine efflux transporter
MNLDRRTAPAALAAAGLLWGTTVPVTKLALQWLPPGWLTVARFGLAAAVLLAAVGFRVRGAASPAVLAWGAVGYGGSILVQNAGITRTSVSHAALLIGATPVLVAVIAALWHRSVASPVAWTGFAVSFAGVGLVAAGGGGGASFAGDGLVLVSLGLSASFTVAQARLLPGRDPVAVTAVQFLAAAVTALPVAAVTEGAPPAAAGGAGPVLATAGLVLLGTLAPATLFAYGQARVSAEMAGSFVNLEPVVGAAAGAAVFGDPVGVAQAAGVAAILTGIALSSLPLLRAGPRSPGQASMPSRAAALAASARLRGLPGREIGRVGARVEGRDPGKWQQFRYVTWPGLKATRTFILVTIAALSLFAQINVMTQGGPLDRTSTVVFQAVRSATVSRRRPTPRPSRWCSSSGCWRCRSCSAT